MKTIKALLLSLLLSIYILPAQADLKVGTVFLYPPFVVSLDQGFDIEFMRLLCQRMKTNCSFTPMDFSKLFSALDNGEIDLAIGGIVISPFREKWHLFSLPYMLSRGQFLVLQSNNANTIQDLENQKIGVIKGGQDGNVYVNYLNNNYPGIFQSVEFDDIEDLITALSSKAIGAAFIHESTALYWEQNGGNQFRVLGQPSIVGDGMGIMTSLQNGALIQQINQQIQATEQDGSYLAIYTTYFGGL
ncbi:transporter substrate-binding domain-containing protein [Legionella cardiaca]|uniref:Transporter substrate-binding domain-containing protein n=1 Tax=Legionella cardiaca TaxID=1071983 RepID=A0ABY8AQN6_9GAMM|nr:transporter substrate-binding domain-containing protein [Legionella cardiaca]WED42749.1 transporter substrate-binding domain-containing protein [Legionella cardiaca]